MRLFRVCGAIAADPLVQFIQCKGFMIGDGKQIMSSLYCANDYAYLGSDSAMIQAAVIAAAEDGAEAVIPCINARTGEKLWSIDETILLPSGCVLTLINAHLRMADGTVCRMFQNSQAEMPERIFTSGGTFIVTKMSL